MGEISDEEIVQLVLKGNKEKYGELISRYEEKLRRYASRVINRSDEVVEDVVEDALVEGYIRLASFDQRRKFSSWIYRIAHNKAVDWIRKNWWRRVVTSEENRSNEDIETKAIIDQEKRELAKAIRKLEREERELVTLAYFEEKSYEEIGEILHLSKSAVGVKLYRIKNKLKRDLRFKF